MDEITQQWIIEDLAGKIPQGVHQRGLFAAALTKICRDSMKLARQIPCWIGPKMTPVAQLTDTDIAFILKAIAEITKREIARQVRAAGSVDGETVTLENLSLENIIKIAHEAHKGMVKRAGELNLVLAGLRRNRMLSWRPDLSKGKLVRSDEQQWAKDLPEGSHRQKESWADKRYEWIEENGAPVKPDWSRINGAQDAADLAEADYCSKLPQHCQDYNIAIGGKMISIPDPQLLPQDIFG